MIAGVVKGKLSRIKNKQNAIFSVLFSLICIPSSL